MIERLAGDTAAQLVGPVALAVTVDIFGQPTLEAHEVGDLRRTPLLQLASERAVHDADMAAIDRLVLRARCAAA